MLMSLPIISTIGNTLMDVTVYPVNIITDDTRIANGLLMKFGVVVVPCLKDKSELKKYRDIMREEILNFPEYNRNPNDRSKTPNVKTKVTEKGLTIDILSDDSTGPITLEMSEKRANQVIKSIEKYKNKPIKYVLGSFQALSNPASFHCHTARSIRMKAYKAMGKMFSDGHEYLEMLFDRLAYRQAGSNIEEDPDKWHRDIAPSSLLKKDDLVYGGWVNLDDEDQRFICVMGSHAKNADGSGFVREKPDNEGHIITIPPGHAIVFHQNILHAIAPTTFKKDSYRQFLGWRVTNDKTPIWGVSDRNRLIDKMAVPKTPSGSESRLASKNHYGALLWSLTVGWGLVTLKEEYHDTKTTKDGNTYMVPQVPLMSLREDGISLYGKYSEIERTILFPVRFSDMDSILERL